MTTMSLTPAHYLPLQLNRYHQNPSSQFPLWGLGSWPSTSLSWRGHKLLFFHTLDILIILHWVRCVVVLTEIPQPQIRSQISPQSQIALGRILNGSHLFSDKPCVFPMSVHKLPYSVLTGSKCPNSQNIFLPTSKTNFYLCSSDNMGVFW